MSLGLLFTFIPSFLWTGHPSISGVFSLTTMNGNMGRTISKSFLVDTFPHFLHLLTPIIIPHEEYSQSWISSHCFNLCFNKYLRYFQCFIIVLPPPLFHVSSVCKFYHSIFFAYVLLLHYY